MLNFRNSWLRIPLAWVMMVAIFALSTPVHATGLIDTQSVVASEQAKADREKVISFLDQEAIQDQLVSWGVDPDEAKQRVDGLTASELAELADKIEEMPAGAGVGAVVAGVLIVFLVLLLTDVLGLTNVFPFTR